MLKQTINYAVTLAALMAGFPLAAAHAADSNSLQLSAPPPTERICTTADLVGTFKLIDVKEKPPGEETKWHQEYPSHYLFFMPDSTYGYVASKSSFSTDDELQKTWKEQTIGMTHTIERKYTLDNTGLFNMNVDDRLEYSYRCLILLKPLDNGVPGDIELLGYSKSNAEVRKLFHKITLKASDQQ